MWADRLACASCGVEAGEACQAKSGREAGYPHGGRELRAEARPPKPAARPQRDAVGRWHQAHVEGIAREQARQEAARPKGGPSLRQMMVVPMWNPWPSKG